MSSDEEEEIQGNAQSIIRYGVWATSSPGSSRFPNCRYLIPNKAESTFSIKKNGITNCYEGLVQLIERLTAEREIVC